VIARHGVGGYPARATIVRVARRVLVLALTLVALAPSGARAATVLVGDVARPGAQAVAIDRGPCDHPLTPEEASGTVASPCAWPAPGGDWGPPLVVQAGDTLEVDLDAPATTVRLTTATTAAPRRVVLGPADLMATYTDGRIWQIPLSFAAADLEGGGLGAALLVDGEAYTLTLNRPPTPVVRPPAPPPLAFGHATLARDRSHVTVTLMTTIELPVTVVLSRQGRRIGRGGATIRPGSARVRVPVGPRNRARLAPGRHVDVAVHYGAPVPVRARGAVLRSPGSRAKPRRVATVRNPSRS
jgi:hypothetical protein